MSWSFIVKVGVGESVGEAVSQGIDAMVATYVGGIEPEAREAAEIAGKIAAEIVSGGLVGSPERAFNISCSGHTNPGHAPRAGYSNDFVSISVYQQPD